MDLETVRALSVEMLRKAERNKVFREGWHGALRIPRPVAPSAYTFARLSGRFTNPTNSARSNGRVVAGADFDPGPAGPLITPDIVWRNRDSGRYVVWHLDLTGNRTGGLFTTPDRPEADPLDWTIVGPK